MSSRGEAVTIAEGSYIAAGTLADLLARIKAEFKLRASPGSGEALSLYSADNLLSSYTSPDSAGTYAYASNANAILKAIAVLSVKNAATASTQVSAGNYIDNAIVNTAYSKIKTMEGYS